MRKILIGVLITFLESLIFLTFSRQSFAVPLVPPGSVSCCQSGYYYFGGSCLNDQVSLNCDVAGGALCSILDAACLAGVCIVPPGCASLASASCQAQAAGGVIVRQNASAFCIGLLNGLGIQNSSTIISACASVVQAPLSTLQALQTTALTQCLSSQSCNTQTGLCQIQPSPAPQPSSTLTPYDPTCDNGVGDSIRTALGCLPTNPETFVNIAIPWSIGIGAGIAFLLGLYGVLMIVVSAGDPEKMQAGKELITSAMTGLLIIIFAVFLLKLIGVNILSLFEQNPIER